MIVKPERPTRTPGRFANEDGYSETHPAYALIGAARVSSSEGATLFGSDFRHRSYISITIRKGLLRRDLSSDWYGTAARSPLIEVHLSEAQWATFLSTLNVGEGVPCTLDFDGTADVPGIIADTDRRAQVNAEVAETLADTIKAIEELRDAATSKKQRDLAIKALQELRSNLGFVSQSFDKHVETTVEQAKIEVAAYVTGAIQRAGLKALAGEPIQMIEAGDDK